MQQALFRLSNAAGAARIARKIEGDHGNFGMNRLRPQQNGFCILNAFGASNRVGETDLPACGLRINLYQMAGNGGCHVPLLGRHINGNACAQDLRARLVLRCDLLKSQRSIVEHSQLKIPTRSKDMPLPIGFQRIAAPWRKKRTAFVAT
jgi:hypothetical protein